MWLFFVFVAVPLIEIALFISVGGAIGLFPTLAIVIVTAFVGTWLVRSQGGQALRELQTSFSDLRDPSEPLAHGAMILFAGALLLTPGFFTDAVGFALLVPGVRQAAFAALKRRVNVAGFRAGQAQRDPRAPHDASTIDGDYFEIDPSTPEPGNGNAKPSGWTEH